MSMVYIANPQGQQIQYEEAEARRLWSEGAILPGSLYWQEGMAEWKPAAEFFGAATAATVTTAALPPQGEVTMVPRGFVKDPAKLTRTLIGFLWAYLAAALVTAIVSALWLLTGQVEHATSEELSAFDGVSMVVGVLQLVIVIVTGVLFLMWIHRANKNARGLGAHGMKFTPGWAVGYYFIPFINLWRPYQAMKEIWQASAHPSQWASQSVPPLLSYWWGLWIANGVLDRMSVRASLRADTSEQLIFSEVITVISSLVGIPLCLVAIRMVREIFRMQSEWVAQPLSCTCAICHQPIPQTDMIIINNAWVCAQCKPILLQQMREGVSGGQ